MKYCKSSNGPIIKGLFNYFLQVYHYFSVLYEFFIENNWKTIKITEF